MFWSRKERREHKITCSDEERDVRCFQHLQTGAVAVRLVWLSVCLPASAGFGGPASPNNVNAIGVPARLALNVSRVRSDTDRHFQKKDLRGALEIPRKFSARLDNLVVIQCTFQ